MVYRSLKTGYSHRIKFKNIHGSDVKSPLMQNIAGTGGAALAALPVIAKIGITAKGISILGGSIAAGTGTIATAKMARNEHQTGEEYSAGEYFLN